MNKQKFKQLHRRIRMIAKAQVGTHGHLSDLVTEFGVTMGFCRIIRDSMDKPKRLVYGKYTAEYQYDQDQADAWDSYYERMVGA